MTEWQPADRAPFGVSVLAWWIPRDHPNSYAEAHVIAQRCDVVTPHTDACTNKSLGLLKEWEYMENETSIGDDFSRIWQGIEYAKGCLRSGKFDAMEAARHLGDIHALCRPFWDRLIVETAPTNNSKD